MHACMGIEKYKLHIMHTYLMWMISSSTDNYSKTAWVMRASNLVWLLDWNHAIVSSHARIMHACWDFYYRAYSSTLRHAAITLASYIRHCSSGFTFIARSLRLQQASSYSYCTCKLCMHARISLTGIAIARLAYSYIAHQIGYLS